MEGRAVGLWASRALQLIFAVIVLAVSISLYREVDHFRHVCKALYQDRYCRLGRLPSSTIFAAFAGAFGLVDAVVGAAASVVDAMPGIAVLAVDGLAAIFYLAAGINLAVLRGSGGSCGEFCTRWSTANAFLFLGLIATIPAMALVFLHRRSTGTRSSTV